MKKDTKQRKNAIKNFKATQEDQWWAAKVAEVMLSGKRALDSALIDIGRMVAEAIMYLEREEIAGPDYQPKSPEIHKWASQKGSIFLGDRKVHVDHPRLRNLYGEMKLKTYEQLKKRDGFSEELLGDVLCGISSRKYHETVIGTSKAFGISPSSVSRHLVEVTAKQLAAFRDRNFEGLQIFAVYLDTVHRGGHAFIVALGIDVDGNKLPLGFWEGATENHDICEALLSDLETRNLRLSRRILWVTDGGSGVIKALKERYGKKLIHQRCTIHKDRNIQKHLPKRYRREAHRLYSTALEQNSYTDARDMLIKFEQWLRQINESAADSLLEAMEQLLTLHKLKVPSLLRKSLHSTNGIESMFSMVRDCEKNIKRYRDSKMRQRWLASVLMHCEKRFRRVKGFEFITEVINAIDDLHGSTEVKKAA